MVSVEHRDYIKKQVDPVLDALVSAVVHDRPGDPIAYMINFLEEREQSNNLSSGAVLSTDQHADTANLLRERIEKLKKEVAGLENKVQEG